MERKHRIPANPFFATKPDTQNRMQEVKISTGVQQINEGYDR